jgi:hypothetical protein
LGEQVKKNEVGRACSTYGENERCIQSFDGGNLRKGGHLEHVGLDGKIILKMILEKWIWEGGGGMDCIDVAQDRDRWQDVVNAVMNFSVIQNEGNFLRS